MTTDPISFYDFVRACWTLVEPAPFVDNWHIGAICEHLEAVSRGELQRLVINVPPRHSKSLLVSVFWPVWQWTGRPETRFLYASYALNLAMRDAVRSRHLLHSKYFTQNWGHLFRLSSDQNTKSRYENSCGGARLSTSVGSMVTGEGGDIIVVDDPHNTREALSKAKREAVVTWWDHAMRSRLNNPQTGCIVGIMQRVHEEDWSAHVLKDNRFEHLYLPMEFEKSRVCHTSIGFKDPRRREGELLNPKRFDRKWCKREKEILGSYVWAGQYQQRPAPLGGGLVKLKWFRRYAGLPPADQVLRVSQFWDTAQKADELLNAPWVCGTWLVTREGYYLAEVFRDWLDYPAGRRMVYMLAQKWNPNEIVIENKSTGQSLLQELEGLPAIPCEPEGDKVMRLACETAAIEAGLVYLPDSEKVKAPWLFDFESEISSFPKSQYKDQADMLSMALKFFRNNRNLDKIEIRARDSMVARLSPRW